MLAWIYLFIAGLFEIGWAVGLKFTEGFYKIMADYRDRCCNSCKFRLAIKIGKRDTDWNRIRDLDRYRGYRCCYRRYSVV